MDLFVYGTLRCPALLSAIVGRDIPVKAATLVDYAVHPVAGHIVPMIKPQDGAKAYVLVPVVVQLEDEQHDVQMYLPPKGQPYDVGDWSLQAWQKDHLAPTLLTVDEIYYIRLILRAATSSRCKASKYPIAGLTAQVAAA